MDFIGYFAALAAGAASFQVVGLKSDLGALIMGMALGRHPRSKEVVIHMISYKDFFLIAFFFKSDYREFLHGIRSSLR